MSRYLLSLREVSPVDSVSVTIPRLKSDGKGMTLPRTVRFVRPGAIEDCDGNPCPPITAKEYDLTTEQAKFLVSVLSSDRKVGRESDGKKRAAYSKRVEEIDGVLSKYPADSKRYGQLVEMRSRYLAALDSMGPEAPGPARLADIAIMRAVDVAPPTPPEPVTAAVPEPAAPTAAPSVSPEPEPPAIV